MSLFCNTCRWHETWWIQVWPVWKPTSMGKEISNWITPVHKLECSCIVWIQQINWVHSDRTNSCIFYAKRSINLNLVIGRLSGVHFNGLLSFNYLLFEWQNGTRPLLILIPWTFVGQFRFSTPKFIWSDYLVTWIPLGLLDISQPPCDWLTSRINQPIFSQPFASIKSLLLNFETRDSHTRDEW